MAHRGGRDRSERSMLERLCKAALGEYPEHIYIDIETYFDPEEFGWEDIMPKTGSTTAEHMLAGTGKRYLTLASPEYWIMEAGWVAALGCAWATVCTLAWHGFFFQRLLESVVPGNESLLVICQAVGFMAGGLVAANQWTRPLQHALPRVVFAAAVGFAVTVLVVTGLLAYHIAMLSPLGYPMAWDGFLRW